MHTSSTSPERSSPERGPGTRRAFVASLVVAGIVVAYAFFSAVPPAAVDLPGAGGRVARVVPQGWGFFTRSPSSEHVEVFSLDGDVLTRLNRPVAFAPRDAFAFRRDGRVRGHQLGALASLVAPDRWHECPEGIAACAALLLDDVEQSQARTGAACGTLLLHRARPVPWLWARDGVREMPGLGAALSIPC